MLLFHRGQARAQEASQNLILTRGIRILTSPSRSKELDAWIWRMLNAWKAAGQTRAEALLRRLPPDADEYFD